MSTNQHSVAVFDSDAFYPLRSLVSGPLTSLDELPKVERFVRAILLHDEMRMEIEPWPASPSEEEETDTGPRNVIVGVGPSLQGYDGLLEHRFGPPEEITIDLSGELMSAAEVISGDSPEGPYYKAYVEYFQRLINTVRSGGSIICDGGLAFCVEQVGTEYPEKLFAQLDEEWKHLAHELRTRKLALLPPCASDSSQTLQNQRTGSHCSARVTRRTQRTADESVECDSSRPICDKRERRGGRLERT